MDEERFNHASMMHHDWYDKHRTLEVCHSFYSQAKATAIDGSTFWDVLVEWVSTKSDLRELSTSKHKTLFFSCYDILRLMKDSYPHFALDLIKMLFPTHESPLDTSSLNPI